MAVIEGVVGGLVESGAASALPMHVLAKPQAYGTLGHYRWGALSGLIPAALAANSEILQFRWSDATRLCIINSIKISAAVSTTFFAAGVPLQISLTKATAWTAVGTGGTRPAVAATLKKRSSMGSSLLGANDIGVATTAALGAGTKTLEATPMGVVVAAGPITASLNGGIILPGTPLWDSNSADGEHPLLLVQNEGFAIRSIAVPATGTWMFAINIDWAEVTIF
jgi:hypothetical protein